MKLLATLLSLLACWALPSFAQSASAQSCSTAANIPMQVRAEGLTELVSDILLTCTGGTPTSIGQVIPQVNITIFLNTNVTNRILANGGTDALLVLDEAGSPNNPRQQLCASLTGCTVLGTGGASDPFNGTDAMHPNIFQGVVSSNVANSITFAGIPADPPGPAGIRTYRIGGIRANANGVGSLGANHPIVASVSTNLLPINTAQMIVAYVLPALSFGAGGPTFTTCQGVSPDQLGVVQFSENFPMAFRPQNPNPASTGSIGESGYMFSGLPGAGIADSGTRLKAVFSNIPSGVSVFISTNNLGGLPSCANAISACAQMVSSEIGAYSPVLSSTSFQGIPVVQLPVANGAASAVWEVMFSDQYAEDSFLFAVFFSSPATLPLNLTPATVTGTLAPSPPSFPASGGSQAQPASFPVPRFANTSPSPTTILSVTACQTTILFPYVISQSGFDTALVIANTSKDPFATPAESGTCALNFYGTNAPASTVSTPTIVAGSTNTMLVSSVAANFQGYIFAVCNFEYAHAFAAMLDSSSTLASAYLALVVSNTPLVNRGGTAEALIR